LFSLGAQVQTGGLRRLEEINGRNSVPDKLITKSAILISAQFNIAALFVHGPKSNHRVAMS